MYHIYGRFDEMSLMSNMFYIACEYVVLTNTACSINVYKLMIPGDLNFFNYISCFPFYKSFRQLRRPDHC